MEQKVKAHCAEIPKTAAGLDMHASLKNVRLLSLRDIAHHWHKQLRLSERVVLLELRRGVLNLHRVRAGQTWLKLEEFPPDEKLPQEDTQVDHDWLEAFCNKQTWPKPLFWFDSERVEHHSRGRPAYPRFREIEAELRRRGAQKEMETTLSAEADYLQRWASKNFSELAPSQKTLKNTFRGLYSRFKSDT
ncbi:hypothetical protein FJ970_21870 [Mesorhizobium sp. B2-1-8]|uniref:hypothetical protein n=1 Tax=Mesorhizobium sp. B2-1-8 TaxID=2589967 RepID=UPI001128BAD1|nr:hypothetical protein [Mesorhizobium sp. B2-1-8]UCI17740.1 hypothetical protein FJ970_21870 [Mesorhizobium sp. B2-1-8]